MVDAVDLDDIGADLHLAQPAVTGGQSGLHRQPRAVGEYGPLHLPALGRRRPQPELRRVVPHDPLDRKAQQPAERLVDKHDQPVAGPHHHHPVRRPVEQALQEPLNALGHQPTLPRDRDWRGGGGPCLHEIRRLDALEFLEAHSLEGPQHHRWTSLGLPDQAPIAGAQVEANTHFTDRRGALSHSGA